eukprot:TRINITY_DN17631_c0_g1::TRINITY_DN17631_c0_g1_i1::g.11434::m.11434 TRINITY_DN17631_c0_g1::TRINITY_DN17631_c0_g1_i1::g.11434  ORF type:complete len:115 (-),score=11.97 TRINITY_DN17631_c0_g1_i1:20-364(-)
MFPPPSISDNRIYFCSPSHWEIHKPQNDSNVSSNDGMKDLVFLVAFSRDIYLSRPLHPASGISLEPNHACSSRLGIIAQDCSPKVIPQQAHRDVQELVLMHFSKYPRGRYTGPD